MRLINAICLDQKHSRENVLRPFLSQTVTGIRAVIGKKKDDHVKSAPRQGFSTSAIPIKLRLECDPLRVPCPLSNTLNTVRSESSTFNFEVID